MLIFPYDTSSEGLLRKSDPFISEVHSACMAARMMVASRQSGLRSLFRSLPCLGRWGLFGLMGTGCLVAQAPIIPASSTIQLYVDCQQFECDMDYFRTQIPWVTWVRDRDLSDVHLILVNHPNGGGGTTTTLQFKGQGRFRGMDDDFQVVASPLDPPDTVRKILVDQIILSLMRYEARIPASSRVTLSIQEPPKTAVPPPADPWNQWVYSLAASGYAYGESAYLLTNFTGEVSATQFTDQRKIKMVLGGKRDQSRYDLEAETLRTSTRSQYGSALVANTIDSHWTWGYLVNALRSDKTNISYAFRVAPGLEYNLWDYAETTKNQFTCLYQVGVTRANYLEETIFSKTHETLLDHSLTLGLSLNKPWGSMGVATTGSQYLKDTSKNALEFLTFLDLKLGGGFAVQASGFYNLVRNQLSLPRSGATDDEVLLRLRELKTNYRFATTIGISYTFGASSNGTVNNRFQYASGGGFFGSPVSGTQY